MTKKVATVIEAHTIPARPPIEVVAGDIVDVGERDTEWPAFVFVTTAKGSGWVPARHLSADAGRATVEVDRYDTTELATSKGETLEVIARDDESGWLWCRSAKGEEGWVPIRSLRG